VPDTYVPFRHSHLICIAASWAEVIGATRVVLGAVEQDSSGYPDCREAYFKAAQVFVDAGTRPDTDISVDAPLLAMRKADIVRRGIELGAPLHLTWSCYRSEDRPCGRCDSCVLRREAFEAAGVPDPAEGQAARH
jgi:7-cyano-7-deazaguanine synthase